MNKNDPFGGAFDTISAHQVSDYVADRVREAIHKASTAGFDVTDTGLEEPSPEKALLRANPSIAAAVASGRMSVHIDGGKTTIAITKGPLAKMRIPIDVEGAAHEEDLASLETQFKVIEQQIEKNDLLKELLENGAAEIQLHDGKLGFHIHERKAIQRPAATSAAEKIAKSYSPTSAQIARDGEPLNDSTGF
jgi:hypothetical protein